MIRELSFTLFILILIFLSACQTADSTPTPTQPPSPSPTAVPPATPPAAPTVTAVPSPSPDMLFQPVSPDPIINAGDGGAAFQRLHNPGAVIFHDGQFHMFRNGYQSLPGNTVIGYATSPDGVTWHYDELEPVFSTDDVPYAGIMIMASSVIVLEDGTWALYFLIWDTASTPGAIGRATAPAPTGPWTPDPAPVFLPGPPGAWDADHVTQPSVLPNEAGDGYLMYYTGVDEEGVERIGLATSPDGITWTRYDDLATTAPPYDQGDPVLVGGKGEEWDRYGAARGRVVRAAEGYVMIYRTPVSGSGFTYGLAASKDGRRWGKFEGNPILERSDIARATGLFFPTFVYHDGTYYFFIEAYAGTSRIHLFTRDEPLDISTITGQFDLVSVVNLTAVDVSNEANASDIQVQFEPPLAEGTAGYRVVVVKAETAEPMTQESALALPAGRFLDLPPMAEPFRGRLPADLTDSDGDPIAEGVPYTLYVLSQNEAGEGLAQSPEPLTLENVTAVRTLITELPSATGGLAVDDEGVIYAANIGPAPGRTGKEIYRITPDGQVSLWVSGQGLLGASGNTFDDEGHLIQSSLSGNAIHRIAPDGTVTRYAREGIAGPVGVVLAPDGTLFVANCYGSSIQRVSPDGTSTVFAEDSLLFRCPNGVTMDEAGTLYVSNFSGGGVVKITPEGEATSLTELPGNNNAHLIYGHGMLFVVARGANQIYTVTSDGQVALLAGTGERGHQDGPALEATFSLPNDIIFSPDGRRLYVNEVKPVSGSANNPSVIRVIELPRDE